MKCIYCGGDNCVRTDVGPVCQSDDCQAKLDSDLFVLEMGEYSELEDDSVLYFDPDDSWFMDRMMACL